MPMLLGNPIVIISAVIIFATSLFTPSFAPQEKPYIVNHRETKNYVVFNLKAKEKEEKSQVIVDKNTGNVKIKIRNKRSDVEFDFEYSGEIAPEDRANIDLIMNSVLEHTKRDKTIKTRIKNYIKDFVNKKL